MQTQPTTDTQELDAFKKLIFPKSSDILITDRFNKNSQNDLKDSEVAACKGTCTGSCAG